jgi:hypothetical protein
LRGILLFARVPMNVVCVRPIYQALREEVSFFSSLKPPKDGATDDPFAILEVNAKRLPLVLARWMPLQVYLSADPLLVGKRCRAKIHTFHGVSFKGRAYTPKVLDYDRLFIVGPYMEETFVAKGILKENDPRIARVGMPKLDPLVDGTWIQDRAKEHLGVSANEKLVLYAPTWGAGSSLEAFGEEVVRACLGQGLKLVVKLHDHTLRDSSWSARLKEWAEAGVVIYQDPDVVPAMAASDLLVSDMSSVANEYLLLDRPLITILPPDYEKRYADTADVDSWRSTGAVIVDHPDSLSSTIIYVLEHPQEGCDQRRSMAKRLFYNPGRATQKAVEVVRGLLDE